MEIQITRKVSLIAATLVALLVGALVVLWPVTDTTDSPATSTVGQRYLTQKPSEPTSITANTPEDAAITFAKTFYVVDYTDYDSWLGGLKVVSTPEGYAILTKSIAPAVWPEIEKAKTVTPAEAVMASDDGLVLEGDSKIGGPWQIRKVTIQIDSASLWPTMKSGDFTALVMLAQEDSQWRFVSFMTVDQIEQIRKGQQP